MATTSAEQKSVSSGFDRLKATSPDAAEETILRTSSHRLILRRINPNNNDDVAFIQELLSSPEWSEGICPMPHVVNNIEEARKWIIGRPLRMYREDGVGSLLAVDTESGERIGIGGLIRRDELDGLFDLGFAISPKYFRRGYAEELSRCVIQWAKDDLKLVRLAAVAKVSNIASTSLLHKLGFVPRPEKPEWWGEPQYVFDLFLVEDGAVRVTEEKN